MIGKRFLVCLLILALSGCSGGGGDGDADADGDVEPDGDADGDTDTDADDDSVECSSNEQCDDGFECTADICGDDGTCGFETDDTICAPLVADEPCLAALCAPEEPEADGDSGCLTQPVDGGGCDPDEASFCYTGWQCRDGECAPDEATLRDCSDDYECTADSCDEELAICDHDPDHERCPAHADGRPGICVPGHAEADASGCIYANPCEDSTDCDDGAMCNGVETCDAGFCFPGEALSCRDGFGCTTDICDDDRGCLYEAVDALCGAVSDCTIHTCDPDDPDADAAGCMHEEVVCIPDVDPCTLAGCTEGFGCNAPAPEGSPCEDYFVCVEGETCNADGLCTAESGTPIVCDDDNPCTENSCEEPAGCVHGPLPDGALCGEIVGECREEACLEGECVETDTTACRAEFSDGCCPDDCTLALDLDCVGRGHVILLGHDYFAHSFAADRIVGNAIFSAAEGDVEVLSYIQYTYYDAVLGEARHTEDAINRRERDFEREWRRDILLHYEDLEDLLPDYDVFLVYEQNNDAFDMEVVEEVGAAWREPLREFVQNGGTVVFCEDTGNTFQLVQAAGLIGIEMAGGVSSGTRLQVVAPGDPLVRDVAATYNAPEGTGVVSYGGVSTWVVQRSEAHPVVTHIQRPPPVLLPWIDPVAAGHSTTALSAGTMDDGQFDIDLGLLTFELDGEDHGCAAVSTNGYIRFGPAGGCPAAIGAATSETDIDEVFPRGIAQISWLGANGQATVDNLYYHVDVPAELVVLTFLDYQAHGRAGTTDVQIILHADSGDIQMSYRDATFDTAGHWSIGVSETRGVGAAFHGHDFTEHWPGTVRYHGPGAVGQSPEHVGHWAYTELDGSAIYFGSDGEDRLVMVGALPE